MPRGLNLFRSLPGNLWSRLGHGLPCCLHPLLKSFPVQSSPSRCRGTKSQASLPLRDLLQRGVSAEQSLPTSEDVHPTYPTVVQQARNNMRSHEGCVLLTRVGSFYEVCALLVPCRATILIIA